MYSWLQSYCSIGFLPVIPIEHLPVWQRDQKLDPAEMMKNTVIKNLFEIKNFFILEFQPVQESGRALNREHFIEWLRSDGWWAESFIFSFGSQLRNLLFEFELEEYYEQLIKYIAHPNSDYAAFYAGWSNFFDSYPDILNFFIERLKISEDISKKTVLIKRALSASVGINDKDIEDESHLNVKPVNNFFFSKKTKTGDESKTEQKELPPKVNPSTQQANECCRIL